MQKVYEKYHSDSEVAFILVSIDDDPARLARFVEATALSPPGVGVGPHAMNPMFAMTVGRTAVEAAAKAFNVNDVPATFYIDREGVIRYQARGLETHGDSDDRVVWYIEELKARR